jgi:3-hydroxyisobutyrate dehydrogenase-like beta-hydroxyacid dehydrogenase
MEQIKRTGIIGLGAMGLQMAKHMAAKGFDVLGYDIDAEAMKRAQAAGVRTADAAAIGRHAEVAIVMVATDEQVRDAVHGLLQNLAHGAVVCIASSVAPETCRDMATLAYKRGVGVLDTPVVLGQEAANNGTLLHLGASGNGQIAKTINNLLLWSCMAANFEALTLAKQLGADIPRLVAALGSGSGANWSLSRWGKSTGKWAEKDMDVALELAQAARVPVPLGGLVDQLVKQINQERMKALLS